LGGVISGGLVGAAMSTTGDVMYPKLRNGWLNHRAILAIEQEFYQEQLTVRPKPVKQQNQSFEDILERQRRQAQEEKETYAIMREQQAEERRRTKRSIQSISIPSLPSITFAASSEEKKSDSRTV
jgi:hypothetical protein